KSGPNSALMSQPARHYRRATALRPRTATAVGEESTASGAGEGATAGSRSDRAGHVGPVLSKARSDVHSKATSDARGPDGFGPRRRHGGTPDRSPRRRAPPDD